LPKREPAGIAVTLVTTGAAHAGWLVSPQRGVTAFSAASQNGHDQVVDRYRRPAMRPESFDPCPELSKTLM
jgi:hypothetical protein